VTDRQRLATLDRAISHLKRTTQGYNLSGSEWQAAMKELTKLRADLKPAPIPELGPLWIPGKSVLDHDLTHATAGVPLYPAFDDAFNQGTAILAVESLEVIARSSSAPGEAFFAKGKSGLRYWYGHLDRSHPVGTRFAKGAAVGRVAANHTGGGPHCHLGINAELILGIGKQLRHHTDYTHGAPTVGAQLRAFYSL